MIRFSRSDSKCKGCPFEEQHKVWGEGRLFLSEQQNKDHVIFLGEAPGKEEDKHGRPFIGESGKLLNLALETVGIRREDNWVTNTISCRPPNNNYNDSSTVNARSRCLPGMMQEVDTLRKNGYSIVAPLGANACRVLGIQTPMKNVVGTVLEGLGLKIIPIYHPSYIIRNGGSKGRLWETWLNGFYMIKKEMLNG